MTAEKYQLPPGPAGRLRPTLQFVRRPRPVMHAWVDLYGDPFSVNAINGRVVFTGRHELIRQILSHDPSDYDVFAAHALGPILGWGSMLTLAGEKHRRERKLIMPMFHGDRMRAYAGVVQAATQAAMASRIDRGRFDALDMTTEISLDVIVGAIFGAERPEVARELAILSKEVIRRTSPWLLFVPMTQFPFLGWSPWDRFMSAKSKLRNALVAEIKRRKSDPKERDDVLSLLLNAKYEDGSKLELEDLLDELSTFLFAGHETSAIAMAWAIDHLHRHPRVLTELRQELRAAEDKTPEEMAKLPYLNAVVSETLRMHPIVTDVLRVLKAPMKLGEYHLPAGVAVAPAMVLAHYCHDTFPAPDEFRPERFLERKFTTSEYFPFGGGHRRCAGAALAVFEMAISLATLLLTCNVELLEHAPPKPVRRNITMGPSTRVPIKLCSR